jgi:hypothetical protein
METVVYIRVPASEVPEVNKTVTGGYNQLNSDKKGLMEVYYDGEWWYRRWDNLLISPPVFYLKPVALSSLLQEGAVEFAEWKDKAYRYWGKDNEESVYCKKEGNYPYTKYYTTTELFNSPEFKKHLEEKYGKETK